MPTKPDKLSQKQSQDVGVSQLQDGAIVNSVRFGKTVMVKEGKAIEVDSLQQFLSPLYPKALQKDLAYNDRYRYQKR
jgi:hypothetical protein